MLPRDQLVPLITGATVLAVPSVYEPLGIVNLEAALAEFGWPAIAQQTVEVYPTALGARAWEPLVPSARRPVCRRCNGSEVRWNPGAVPQL
jgi:glycosyltransferase involved in cell wall biosynthesis